MSEPEDDEIEIVTPQFERPDGAPEPSDPPSPEAFAELKHKSEGELLDMGMRRWPDNLWLFPGEWFDDIPEGYVIETVNGNKRRFNPERESRDIRFGCLAFGIRRETEDESGR